MDTDISFAVEKRLTAIEGRLDKLDGGDREERREDEEPDEDEVPEEDEDIL